HEAAQHRMVGERAGRVFRLGQKLQVRVVRVNLEERKIDFELVDKSTDNIEHKKTRPGAGKKVKVSAKAAELASEYEKKRKRRAKTGTKKKTKGKAASTRGKAGTKRKSSAKAKKRR
ncbi:MAG: ribonuclease R, partial [Porticoccaceae bacterium]